ncbi:hypothetical protein MMC12_003500 [Toensbergia leucococca]|nr:hypothetical protein [Toensbergia leucococca]
MVSNPDRGPPSVNLPMGQLPAAPTQWHGADESMRNWLQAKAEEDRRKQEEERTRQETLRLEQRKIEQTMLRESLQGGIPPHMVPMVFAGMGGGNLANASLEWAQHYMAQITLQQQAQLQQQQLQAQTTPELRRESRMLGGPQPNPYGAQQPQAVPQNAAVLPGQQLPSQQQPNAEFMPSYQTPNIPTDRARTQQPSIQAAQPTSAPRAPAQSTLPRLNTGEMQIHPPPQGPPNIQLASQHPVQQAHATQQRDQHPSSPSIYFHHWVPPTTQAGAKDPQTPSGKSQHESPYSQNAASHLRSEYTSSPKKRKATGSHHVNPAPSSNHPDTSPSFSQNASSSRRRGHSRQRSDGSTRHRQQPGSGRQSMSEAESGSQRQVSTQPETRQSLYSAGPETRHGSERNSSPKREPEGPS